MFEPQRTTEVLFAVPTDASHADKLNVHKEWSSGLRPMSQIMVRPG